MGYSPEVIFGVELVHPSEFPRSTVFASDWQDYVCDDMCLSTSCLCVVVVVGSTCGACLAMIMRAM